MNRQFSSVDLNVLEKLAHDHGETNNYSWHDDPVTRLITGLAVLKQHGSKGLSGVHTIATKPNLKRVEYAFDFRDKNGDKILPFTIDQPLLRCLNLYTDMKVLFPELKHVHTVKIGRFDMETCARIIRTMPFVQQFDTFSIRYDGGILTKNEKTIGNSVN